jgi:RES domain-containing protein
LSAVLWRIGQDTPAYESHDLSGKGAEITGGRWNAVGTPMVYTSPAISLALLETLVHFNAHTLPLNRYLVRLEVPDDVWSAADHFPTALVGWDAEPPGRVSIDWGTRWCHKAGSALLRVPSVVVPEECNVLINPKHPDAQRITAVKVRRWQYDERLQKTRR